MPRSTARPTRSTTGGTVSALCRALARLVSRFDLKCRSDEAAALGPQLQLGRQLLSGLRVVPGSPQLRRKGEEDALLPNGKERRARQAACRYGIPFPSLLCEFRRDSSRNHARKAGSNDALEGLRMCRYLAE